MANPVEREVGWHPFPAFSVTSGEKGVLRGIRGYLKDNNTDKRNPIRVSDLEEFRFAAVENDGDNLVYEMADLEPGAVATLVLSASWVLDTGGIGEPVRVNFHIREE